MHLKDIKSNFISIFLDTIKPFYWNKTFLDITFNPVIIIPTHGVNVFTSMKTEPA